MATGRSEEAAGTGRTVTGGGAEGRTGQATVAQGAKEQAGNVDPGMEFAKAGAVAGEGKAVPSNRSRGREQERLRRARKH